MSTPIAVPRLAARRFMLRAQGFDGAFKDVDAALTHLGYVQIDPLNICGRMHDLILRNRVRPYREGDLMRHVHGDAGDDRPAGLPGERRTAFEHHLPDTNVLVAFPLEAWPHLRAAMRARAKNPSAWSGRLTPTERRLAPQLLAEIARRGPLSSEDFEDRRRARRVVWGKASLVKSTLQKLFFHGELLIAARNKHRRRYDLPERVIPPRLLSQPDATPAETERWLVMLKLRQRRLAALKRAEIPRVADAVHAVAVDGCPLLHCLKADVDWLREAAASKEDSNRAKEGESVRLLAPLDPLIYDRRVTRSLWDFDYTWEAYTPPAKRVRGHYALPVLAGTELVGHVEPKVDRTAGKLALESRSIRRGHRMAAALDELAAWLGVRR